MNTSHRDPTAPLVIDTRELGRRPGSQREFTHSVPAPADFGIEVLGVREGAPVELDLRLEAVMEGVLVTGTVSAGLSGECVRCLEPISDEIESRFQELYVYDDARHDEGDDEDSDVRRLEGDLLDLEPVLRDAVVLAYPSSLCVMKTVLGCAPNVVLVWPTIRITSTRTRSTPDGPVSQH